MNIYRSHNCNELRKKDVCKKVLLSWWINKKRDHGNLLFIDLRDNYGITQCIIDRENQNFSGKSHLINIFIKKFKGIIFNADTFDNNLMSNLDIHQNIVLENFNNKINEKLIYTLINTIEQNNKYLIITSYRPVSEFNFSLNDLKSRAKNFLIQEIQKPDDELIFALLIKNLSDRQIIIEKKLLNYIVKRIHRSYSKIFDFIYKIDEMSLKKKKPINVNLVKEILGE